MRCMTGSDRICGKILPVFAVLDDGLPADLGARLHHYNIERPHPGYRNTGRRSVETVPIFRTKAVLSAKNEAPRNSITIEYLFAQDRVNSPITVNNLRNAKIDGD